MPEGERKAEGRSVSALPTPDMPGFKLLLGKVAGGTPLSAEEAKLAFSIMMAGDATPSQMGGFLMALRVRGETRDEIEGAVRAMRARMLKVKAPEGAIDTVGTGGDASGTYNVSTASAFVLAGCGVPVAKHGNRALSSKSGAADVLTALGVNIEAPLPVVERALREAGIAFLMAPRHHSAMRHVGPTRVELGTRTIFNLLGPLANPAEVKRLLVGVFAPEWLQPFAEVLRELGTERAWVVHGAGGLDEMSTLGATEVVELDGDEIRRFQVTPEEVGLQRAELADIKGGDAETNAEALRGLLHGKPGPYRDIVVLTAAAGLVIAGKAASLEQGVVRAASAIDDGHAQRALDRLVEITNEGAEEGE